MRTWILFAAAVLGLTGCFPESHQCSLADGGTAVVGTPGTECAWASKDGGD